MYPHGDNRTDPVEVGASIFMDSNRHMVKAAKVRAMCGLCGKRADRTSLAFQPYYDKFPLWRFRLRDLGQSSLSLASLG